MSHNQNIHEITIENFKCFRRFHLHGMQQVNLIGGNNNIGKTAFLEACYSNCMAGDLQSLIGALADTVNFRKYPNIRMKRDRSGTWAWSFSEKDLEMFEAFTIETNMHRIKFALQKEALETVFHIQHDSETHTFRHVSFDPFATRERTVRNVNFLPSFRLPNVELSELFDMIQLKNQEPYLLESIRFFDERISQFKFISSIPHCYVSPENTYYPLSSFGSGLRRFISLLCAIWASENGQLFIDEIEDGIHYTKYSTLWEILFRASREANCQIFVTTHSKECIEAFSAAAEHHNSEQIKYVNLSREADNGADIVATLLDSIGLENNFQLGLDVR